MNESMVTPYPLVDITQRIGIVESIRYPMAGMLSHQVKVGIYNPATGETLYLDAGDPKDRYFTNISWAPDERSLFLIEVNRDQNHAKLCQYDAQTGKLMGVLYEETHPKYVEPQQPIVFLPWDDTQFIYQSQRDGYNHLYLMSVDNPSPRQLTQGPWLVQSILGFNAKKKEVIIAATKESPLQSNIYKVRVKDGRLTPIDNGQGVHNAQLSASGTYVIDNWSSPQVPRSPPADGRRPLPRPGDAHRGDRHAEGCRRQDRPVLAHAEAGGLRPGEEVPRYRLRLRRAARADD